MSNLRPCLEVAQPRKEIADGTFAESLFAADLGMVDQHLAPDDYLDPVTFCDKTYLTELVQRRSHWTNARPPSWRRGTNFSGSRTGGARHGGHRLGLRVAGGRPTKDVGRDPLR